MASQPQTAVVVPTWTLPDRLRKAREVAHLSQGELGDEIDVHRNSISAYEAGRTVPRKPVLLAWALRCGVPYRWLAYDENEPDTPPDLHNVMNDRISRRRLLDDTGLRRAA